MMIIRTPSEQQELDSCFCFSVGCRLWERIESGRVVVCVVPEHYDTKCPGRNRLSCSRRQLGSVASTRSNTLDWTDTITCDAFCTKDSFFHTTMPRSLGSRLLSQVFALAQVVHRPALCDKKGCLICLKRFSFIEHSRSTSCKVFMNQRCASRTAISSHKMSK